MHILSIGLNHETAGIQLRERLAFNEESVKATLSRLRCGHLEIETITEMAILSTCNRVELFAVSSELSFDAIECFLSEVQNIPQEDFHAYLYRYADEGAVEHLFRVAASLDSLVLGEAQILGQVAQAFELARGQNTAGPILSRLFQTAIHTGKRARSETAIGHNPASVSSVAVKMAADVVHNLATARVAVLGAGEMAELVVEAMLKRGVKKITVVNRTIQHAQELAKRWGGKTATFEQIHQVLLNADILITSTGAPHTIIHTDMVKKVMIERSQKPLVIVDIAVPRDVEPQVGTMPGITLYDIDSLNQRLEFSLAGREKEIPNVEAIVAEEKENFLEFIAALDVLPIIAEIRQQAEAYRQAELEKTLRRLPELSEEDRKRIEALTNALVKKLINAPLGRFKKEAGSPCAARYATLVRALYGLGELSCEDFEPAPARKNGLIYQSNASTTTPPTSVSRYNS